MPLTRVLMVDDDAAVRFSLGKVLEHNNFEVAAAANVPEALKLITTQTFDVLLSDLHMPGAGDGLTVISAMRHSNPQAVTLLLTAHPAMGPALDAILLQTDKILVKPMDVQLLVDSIRDALAHVPTRACPVENVAAILDRSTTDIIQTWLRLVEKDEKVMTVKLSPEDRAGHLPRLLKDLAVRLRSSHPLGSKALVSAAACDHGLLRHQQGYGASMLVEESRMFQVSLFDTLQRNLASIDFSLLMLDVMTIADECDSQLAQAMECYCVPDKSAA